jgi:hypothetical protein
MCTGFWWGTLGRPRHRWEDNISMDLKEIRSVMGWQGPCSSGSVRGEYCTVLHMVINLVLLCNADNFFTLHEDSCMCLCALLWHNSLNNYENEICF